MLGSQPSEIDAVMFGFLAQIKWQTNQNSPIAVALNCKLMQLNISFLIWNILDTASNLP